MSNPSRGFLGVFGSFIARWLTDSPAFYPLWGNFFLQRKLPIYVDLNNLMIVYLSEPHLRLVIDRKADMFKNAEITIQDKNGKIIDKHPVLDLIRNPNPMQSQEDFMFMYSVYEDIYAQNFIYKLSAFSNQLAKILWILPPDAMKIQPTGKIWEQNSMDGIISYYEMFLGDNDAQPVIYKPNEIIHISQGVSSFYITGESKIKSLKYQISNIQGALKTRNCIIQDRGALQMVSPDTGKGGNDPLPLGSEERKKIENQYRKSYGLDDDQMKTIFATQPMKVQQMGYPTKDLLLFEEVEEDFQAICGAYGMARDIFPSTKGATYENMDAALKQTYQNTIQPAADTLMRKLSREFGLDQQGLKLVADYSYLPIMKEDQLREDQAKFQKAQALALGIANGIISPKQFAEEMGWKMDGTGVPIAPAAKEEPKNIPISNQ